MFARLLYGFRVSVIFALVLTAIGTVLGLLAGAVQGYFGGRTDLTGQRLIEIWSAMPELYLLIIFASIFEPSLVLLVVLLSLFGWIGLSDYVRAEFLRNRTQDYVRAARAMGLSNCADHLASRPAQQPDARYHLPAVSHERGDPCADQPRLPRPRRAAADADRSANCSRKARPISTRGGSRCPLSACWSRRLLLLTFMGDALRNALDTRISDAVKAGGGQ